jgi:CDK-activating kinase assembly factor MAT1
MFTSRFHYELVANSGHCSFNREECDFETLRDYNDYLNDVEDSIYNLIYGIDIEATEKKMQDYQAANRQAIEDNLARAKQGTVDFNKHREAEQRAERARRQAERDAEETERRIKEREKRELFEQIEAGGDAELLMKQASQVTLRRAKKLRREAQESEDADVKSSVTIKGLKKHVEPEVEKENPYDPFDGMDDRREYYQIYDQYQWLAFDNLKDDVAALAGGINFHEHRERALCDAFSGLGVIIGEDLPTVDSMAGHGIATSEGTIDDVF